MTAVDDRKKAIYEWFKAATALPTIWEEQAQARPARPYASLNVLTGSTALGDDSQVQVSSGQFEMQGQRKFTVSCSIWADDALQKGEDVQTSLGRSDVTEKLRKAGLSVIDNTSVTELGQLFGTRWEARTQMDVVFGFSTKQKDIVGTIEKVELDSTDFNGGTSEIIEP